MVVSYTASALAFSTQSSQQTVISFPPTVTVIPPSVISQSQTGHFTDSILPPINFRKIMKYLLNLSADLHKTYYFFDSNQAIRFLLISRREFPFNLARISDGVRS